MKLNIQMFANEDGKVVIGTDLNTKNFQNGLDRMQNATKKAGSTIKNIVYGLGISKLISYSMQQITNSIDGAVARVDTLNNFPKVMSNLGIASEDAEKSIKKMSKQLSGLPTTLDEGARAVQRFTSKNSDVAKSTDLFLALNNAILAGGASTEIQSSALEQLSQAYAKGKPDMMEWRTAMTAMPAQLKQVAQAMGYINADELGVALREGTVSMDEFMDTIVLLNEKGIDGFQSFEKQARNSTGGIKTSITVAKTQIVKGVADIIGALNTRFEKTEFGSLPNFIKLIGDKSKENIDNVALVINGELSLFDFGAGISDMINRMVVSLNNNFPKIFNAGVDAVLQFTNGLISGNSIQNLMANTNTLLDTISNTIIDRLPDFFNIGVDIITNIIDGLFQEQPNLIENVGNITTKIIQTLGSDEFIDKLYQSGGKILVALIKGMILSIPKLFEATQKIKSELTNQMMNLPSKFFRVGVDIIIGLWNGIKSEIGGLNKKFTKAVDGIVASVKKKLKIASPSKRFRDEIGKQMSAGIGVGFEDELSNVYRDMQRAIDMEQKKLVASVETGRVFNTIQNSTPIAINVNGDVEMDSQKVGRLVTPTVTRTIKNGGGV